MMTMEELVAKLNEASEAYYNGKEEIMSNKEFDDLMDQLKAMEKAEGRVLPDSPTINVGFKPVDSLPKFTHTYPALSLDKTKDINEFVNRFYLGIEESGDDDDGVVLMWKLDGCTVQAYYENGSLAHLVTRGNGEIGSDITHNARAISGIPLKIPFEGDVVVRGEALISYNDFNEINDKLPDDKKFKNPRNLASASIQMLDPEEVKSRHVIVKMFNLVDISDSYQIDFKSPKWIRVSDDEWVDKNWTDYIDTFSGRLKLMERLGFNVVEHSNRPVYEIVSVIKISADKAEEYSYPVDGLVAAMNNYKYTATLKGTEHHPHIMSGYAFKWEDAVQKTVLREIEWSPSRTGLLNPVAIFDPIQIDGTTVQRASVHNVSIMREMDLRIGDDIGVMKANLVIPQVAENYSKNTERQSSYDAEMLDNVVCPTCGQKAVIHKSADGIETMYCSNESCPEKMIGKLAHFCERDCMDIQGMSEETIKKLVEAGFVKEYADFFKLNEKPGISFLPGFGKLSWKNMCDAAELARKTGFIKFFTAIGIPNIGKGQIKNILVYVSINYIDLCNQYDYNSPVYSPATIVRLMASNDFDFTVIEGFGDILAKSFKDFVKKNLYLCITEDGTYIEEMTPETNVLKELVFMDAPTSIHYRSESSKLVGKSFCITGKLIHHSNREELVHKIEVNGGRWIDSVSSKTDYLINNDVTSTSGKNKKAHELNIPIISEEDFLKMIEE